ncbi:uncharacterized protein LOC121632338 isoform X1 [Melanotaenia boesemani]|uniref:uncharacterized protein LOC121632338 isoform X1 n=1 Tax=Melanotaenia boesemani TaxID=1250792 RepID=UPI001C058CAC|nr:uncharacterized protein LOC121632338 isoform X1 [Melanotaenia boesemani]
MVSWLDLQEEEEDAAGSVGFSCAALKDEGRRLKKRVAELAGQREDKEHVGPSWRREGALSPPQEGPSSPVIQASCSSERLPLQPKIPGSDLTFHFCPQLSSSVQSGKGGEEDRKREEEETKKRQDEEERKRRNTKTSRLRTGRKVLPGGVQQLMVIKEEVPWSSSLDHQDPEPLHIKKEEEELWTSQEGEQLCGQEETDISRLSLNIMTVKSEDDEEGKPHSFIRSKLKTAERQNLPPAAQIHRWKQKLMERTVEEQI